MGISFDGNAKVITLDTSTSFTSQTIYDAVVNWAVLSGNMQYLIPMTGSGKAPLGGGVYTDIIYVLTNGWKLQPSGYSAGTQISVSGTFITSDNSIATIAPVVGSPVTWVFIVATDATVVEVSTSALTPTQAAQLSEAATNTEIILGSI